MNNKEEEDSDGGEALVNSGDKELETAELDLEVEILLNSVVGFTKPKTMKLQGWIWEQEAVTLIDPRATHNFLYEFSH